MAGSSKPKGRKGKIGKKKAWIASYYNSGRNFFNKARRLIHHMRKVGDTDKTANEALKVAMAGMSNAKVKELREIYKL